jgi:pimeloyl-ACP methyl ester carboxylesterase
MDATMKQRNLVDVDWALAAFNMGSEDNGVAEGSGLIAQVTCPVLSFWGDKDMVVLQYMVQETVAAIGDNARFVILENCGHSPLTDALESMMAAQVKAFLP